MPQKTVSPSFSRDTNRSRRRFANGGQRNSTFVSMTIASWGTARRAVLQAEGISDQKRSCCLRLKWVQYSEGDLFQRLALPGFCTYRLDLPYREHVGFKGTPSIIERELR